MDDARRPCSALAWLQEVTGGAAFRHNPYRAVRGFAAVGSDGYCGRLTIHLENLRTLTEKLPPAPFFYEAWLVTAAGQAVSAGAFNAGTAGSAAAGFDLEPDDLRCSGIPLSSVAAILVTAEPFDGNPMPATPILQGRLFWQGEGALAWSAEPPALEPRPAPAGAPEAQPARVAAPEAYPGTAAGPGVNYTGFAAPADEAVFGALPATLMPPAAASGPVGTPAEPGTATAAPPLAPAGQAMAAAAAGNQPTGNAAPPGFADGEAPVALRRPAAPDWGVTPPPLVPGAPGAEHPGPYGEAAAGTGPDPRGTGIPPGTAGSAPAAAGGPPAAATGVPPAQANPPPPAAGSADATPGVHEPVAHGTPAAVAGDPPAPPGPVSTDATAGAHGAVENGAPKAADGAPAEGAGGWDPPPVWPPAPLLPEALQRPPADPALPGGPVLRAQTVLSGASPLTAMTQAVAQLDFAQGGLLLTLRGMPAPQRFGSAATGREYNGYKAWLVNSRTREAATLGALPRIWHDTYRIQVREGLPLERFDTLQVTVEDRTAPAGMGGPIVLSGRYASLLAPRR